MTNNHPFDFTVDKAAKQVFINREFAAGLSLVWDAFTIPELLDQWWAPKPFVSRTKHMDFKVGGRRFYAMVTPEGQERWSVQQYRSISPKTNFRMYNAFSDEQENMELPGSDWDLHFSEGTGADGQPRTNLRIVITNESLERMERMIEMGFTAGFAACLAQLDEVLSSSKDQ